MIFDPHVSRRRAFPLLMMLLISALLLWGCDDESSSSESDTDLVDDSSADLDAAEETDLGDPDLEDGEETVDPDLHELDTDEDESAETEIDVPADEEEDLPEDIIPDEEEDLTTGTGTVYDITSGVHADGELLQIDGLLVTGVNTTETTGHPVFMQVPPDSPAYDGVNGSGLYVYFRKTEPVLPEVGDIINFRGKVENDEAMSWVNYARGVEIVSSGNDLPAPIQVSVDEIDDSGARAKALTALRVEVIDVFVTDAAPTPGSGDTEPTNEFEVGDSLRVDDFLYALDFPELNDHYEYLRGHVFYDYGHRKLLPNSAEDALRHPRLASLTPETLVLQPDTSRSMTLSLNRPAPFDLDVTLSYSSGALTGPASLSFSQGEQALSFDVTGVSESASVILSADYDMDTLSADIAVVDVDPVAVVEVQPAFQKWAVNSEAAFTILLEGAAPAGGQVVDISTSGNSYNLISVVESVIIPEGEDRMNVAVSTLSQTGTAEIYAYTTANSDVPTTEIMVVPSFPSELIISEVLYNPIYQDDDREWVVLFNSSGAPVDLTGATLRFADSTAPNFNSVHRIVDLPDAIIPIGGCYLIGGPESAVETGSPVFDYAVSIEMSNASSASSAGVAFFDASEQQGDTLIYGGNGSNPDGIAHADGSEAVDLDNDEVINGGSVKRRQDLLWEANDNLEPNICPPF